MLSGFPGWKATFPIGLEKHHLQTCQYKFTDKVYAHNQKTFIIIMFVAKFKAPMA